MFFLKKSHSFIGSISAVFLIATVLCLNASGDEPIDSSSKSNFDLDQNTATTLATKIDELVRSKYLDQSKVDKIWRPAYDAARPVLIAETSLLDFSKKMNEILALLQTSHTQLYTQNDEGFFFMRSLFGNFKRDEKNPNKYDADFTGLGVGGAQASHHQVRYVLDASPAEKAGFKRGDIIISVNDKPYSGYACWSETSGKPCAVHIERQGKPLDLTITPVKQDFEQGYLTATEKSTKIIANGKSRIAYLHFWSGGQGTHEALEDALSKELMGSDALVLDLRDGYGGASLQDIEVFFRPHSAFPDMNSIDRKGSHFERSYYDKPVAVLINRGTRSGKELMAFGLKRSKRATLFGENTAGYVVGGNYNPLDSRTMLYLATVDITLDGKRLEAIGVSPDIAVEDKLGSDDAVLNRALTFLSNKLMQGTGGRHRS